ncbi:M12 family metallo-peptidase [Glaciecola sp. SC05]|uniref:M12 family metallo-peptidase n=1 Tax=Glaciecola sp. SC05 TaxID=1987355 RepID=UPI0035273D3C
MLKTRSSCNTKYVFALVLLMLMTVPVIAEEFHEKIFDAQVVSNIILSTGESDNKRKMLLITDTSELEFDLEENTRLLDKAVLSDIKLELYKGQIVGNSESWARFTNIGGVVTGAYFDGEKLFILEDLVSASDDLSNTLSENAKLFAKGNTSPSVVIDASKIISRGTCGLHDHSDVERFGYVEYLNELDNMTQSTTIREIAISLVADVEYVNGTSNATADMISDLNVADGIFKEQLNIQFLLTDTTELSDNGTLTSTNPETLIFAFRDSNFPNPGLRHLFTGKNLNGSTVGIAFVNSLCRNSSVGITQRFGAATAIILAHELGHNFGAPHDSEGGSVCSSTPSGFIMFPSVNTNADTFSSCSVSQMLPVINNASSGFNACVSEVEIGSAPVISSNPNLNAIVGESYAYDSDNQVNVDDASNFTFNLDIAPNGMTLDDTGVISWIPSADQIGFNPVQISVSNAFGNDTQFFEVIVEPVDDVIDFSEFSIDSYGGNQDANGSASLGETNFELVLNGNTWKSIDLDLTVNTNTILEFEFFSDVEAEIQGIGFDTDVSISSATSFQIFGTQNWGIRTVSYSAEGAYQSIRIPVGNLVQGDFSKVVFILDNDTNISDANARFRNVRIFDEGEVVTGDPIDLSLLTFAPHIIAQDISGTVTITDNGFGVELVGNRWQKVFLETASITPNTVLSFEFKSSQMGEIHGIGFLPENSLNQSLAFQLLGTQRWGNNDFAYSGNGEFQTFTIPVGQYFTQSEVEMVFIMDHDVSNPTGVSHFRNISLFEPSN